MTAQEDVVVAATNQVDGGSQPAGDVVKNATDNSQVVSEQEESERTEAEAKPESGEKQTVTKEQVAQIKESITSQKLTDDRAKKLYAIVQSVPEILKSLDNPEYDEIFGYRINVDTAEYVQIPIRNEILLKFLIANEYDVAVTKKRIVETMNWRNKFQPLTAAYDEMYDVELSQLGVITQFPPGNDNLQVVTWNLYGNLKTPKKLFEKFGGSDGDDSKPGSHFLRWRIGLMERSLGLVDFTDPKNHKIGQVHDYTGASFFKMDSGMKSNTKEIITIFGDNYPELLSTKYFVGIPVFMSWVFSFLKNIGLISKETLKKFQVISGRDMTAYFSKDLLPADYGGSKKVSLFDIKVKDSKITEYGEVLLKKLGAKQLDSVNDTVE
jgi:hypothetical protein